MPRPTLTTSRLTLRPFRAGDADDLLAMIDDRNVTSTTFRISGPAGGEGFDEWLALHDDDFDQRRSVRFAIALRDTDQFVGSITLHLDLEHEKGELGYWIGHSFWSNGYATEAAHSVLEYGFRVWNLNRIEAHAMIRNRASTRVLSKIGMKHEGTHPQLVKRFGSFEDVATYGILRSDYLGQGPPD